MSEEEHKKVIINTKPGVLGDGTEEQNLGQRGHPEDRIKKAEVKAAFGHKDGHHDEKR